MEFRRALLPFFFPAVWLSFPSIKLDGRRPSSSSFSKMSIAAWYPFFSNSSNLLNWSVPYYSKMSARYEDLCIRMLNYLLDRHLNIKTILGYFGLFQGIDAWYTKIRVSSICCWGDARFFLLCQTTLDLGNGRDMPCIRERVPSVDEKPPPRYCVAKISGGIVIDLPQELAGINKAGSWATYRANVRSEDGACTHGTHGCYLEKEVSVRHRGENEWQTTLQVNYRLKQRC
jgi:hypothetical protein